MVEAEVLRPNAYHAPTVPAVATVSLQAVSPLKDLQQNDTNHDGDEHGLCSNTETLLDPPETIDTNGLGTNTKEKEIGQGKSVIRDDSVLKCSNHRDGGIERVT